MQAGLFMKCPEMRARAKGLSCTCRTFVLAVHVRDCSKPKKQARAFGSHYLHMVQSLESNLLLPGFEFEPAIYQQQFGP